VAQKYQTIVEDLFGLAEILEILGNATISGVTPTAATSLLVVSRSLGKIAQKINKDLDVAAKTVLSAGESIAAGPTDRRNIPSPE
jgi:hypothetical protein